MKRVAIQGVRGSFHDIAAHEYFGEDVELICCHTFEEIFERMQADSSVYGFLAIENTIAGSLLHNHELLNDSAVQIVGEHKLRITHSLLCLPEDDWADLKEVHSHPVALAQCRTFLQGHPTLKAVEHEDTAGSAQEIADRKLRGVAAICSHRAAEMYGMKVLAQGIETNKRNFTRFLVVASETERYLLPPSSVVNKANIVFSLPHTEGALSQILSVFSFYKINLTKIQSLPIIGREWEYLFYVDVMFDDYARYRQSLEAVKPLMKSFKLLGEYEEGRATL